MMATKQTLLPPSPPPTLKCVPPSPHSISRAYGLLADAQPSSAQPPRPLHLSISKNTPLARPLAPYRLKTHGPQPFLIVQAHALACLTMCASQRKSTCSSYSSSHIRLRRSGTAPPSARSPGEGAGAGAGVGATLIAAPVLAPSSARLPGAAGAGAGTDAVAVAGPNADSGAGAPSIVAPAPAPPSAPSPAAGAGMWAGATAPSLAAPAPAAPASVEPAPEVMSVMVFCAEPRPP